MSPGTRIYLTLEKHIPPWESWRAIFRKSIFFSCDTSVGVDSKVWSFRFFQISHQRIQVFLDHRDPLHIADLLSHHPLSHIWVPATVTMTTPLKLDRRWLHGPACEKQSDSLLLSLLPFFAPSLLRFVAYLKPSQLLNRLHRKLHLFILFSAPPPERFDAVLGFFAVKAASFTAKMMTQKVPLFLWSFWWLLLVMPVCVCMCYTSKLYMFQFTH